MKLSRHDLEQLAIDVIDAEYYYDLMDSLDETPDQDLLDIINETE